MVGNRYISDIKNCKIVAVYEVRRYIEFCYIKDNIQKSLIIEQNCHFGPMYDGCWFEFGGVALPSELDREVKKLSKTFSDIESIQEINFYTKELDNGVYIDLEILYRTKDGRKNSYLLHPQPHEEEVHEIVVLKNKKSTFKLQKTQNVEMPKELYCTKNYKDALAFALKAHGEQKTPEGLPYAFHIVSVANEIINSLSMHPVSYDEANVAIACALLHDVNEDTHERVSSRNLKLENVNSIVHGVEALTKDTTLPSKQLQMQDSLKRLKKEPKCVQMVKLADRITNLAPAPLFWNKAKRKSYVEEAKQILKALKDSNSYLAKKLQDKIDNYQTDKILNNHGVPMEDNYLVFFAQEKQLILDKNHSKYLKTFKAINRLNEYVKKEYDLELFSRWDNRNTFVVKATQERLGISYIVEVLNKKELLNLNKQIDDKIAKFISIIYEGEDVVQLIDKAIKE